ncbi:hypothetical protein BGZ67_007363 [Mortierella alpina]|nr:hypothetical protein BGZ67_007363 [Mortierella alpina]
MRKSLILLALLAASANAAQVSFHVIAPGATTVQVSINNKRTTLTAADPSVPHFTGAAEADDGAKYKYVVNNEDEPFERRLKAGVSKTHNDFFKRPVTYADIPHLPSIEPIWKRSGPKQALFDSNYIPTIWVEADRTEVNTLVKKPHKNWIKGAKVTFILADEEKTFTGVNFGIHGAGKKHNNAKQSWRWELAGGDSFANRNYFKLRHMEEDPTQIREKLYADVARALGTYANEANMVRLFINGVGFGTFNLLDDITQYSYPKAMFYAGNPSGPMGALFDGQSGASFAVDSSGVYDAWVKNPTSPEEVTAIGPLCEAWSRVVKTDDAEIGEFSKQFDVDQFLRFMIMEYLTGHWDGYWMGKTNDGVYRDPTLSNMWFYLGQDFDATFGVNIPEDYPTLYDWSYKYYPGNFTDAVMINGLLKNPTQRATFEQYLRKTVEVLFNNVVLTNRILTLHDFYLPDLEWDRGIKQLSPGINFGWTMKEVKANLRKGVSAPNNNGGGAEYGLIEWIIKKAAAVAKEFNIVLPSSARSRVSRRSTIREGRLRY